MTKFFGARERSRRRLLEDILESYNFIQFPTSGKQPFSVQRLGQLAKNCLGGTPQANANAERSTQFHAHINNKANKPVIIFLLCHVYNDAQGQPRQHP